MPSSVIMVPSPPSRPVASHEASRLAALLHQPRKGHSPVKPDAAKRWGTIGFMIAIHGLSAWALLPQFWSWQAVAALAILYWVTACLGVTIGYHRLLSHRSFRVPTWLCLLYTSDAADE